MLKDIFGADMAFGSGLNGEMALRLALVTWRSTSSLEDLEPLFP